MNTISCSHQLRLKPVTGLYPGPQPGPSQPAHDASIPRTAVAGVTCQDLPRLSKASLSKLLEESRDPGTQRDSSPCSREHSWQTSHFSPGMGWVEGCWQSSVKDSAALDPNQPAASSPELSPCPVISLFPSSHRHSVVQRTRDRGSDLRVNC